MYGFGSFGKHGVLGICIKWVFVKTLQFLSPAKICTTCLNSQLA